MAYVAYAIINDIIKARPHPHLCGVTHCDLCQVPGGNKLIASAFGINSLLLGALFCLWLCLRVKFVA